jgi:hypothetical protein
MSQEFIAKPKDHPTTASSRRTLLAALRRGGVQIILMRAVDGLGVFGLAQRKLSLGRSALKTLSPPLVRLVP